MQDEGSPGAGGSLLSNQQCEPMKTDISDAARHLQFENTVKKKNARSRSATRLSADQWLSFLQRKRKAILQDANAGGLQTLKTIGETTGANYQKNAEAATFMMQPALHQADLWWHCQHRSCSGPVGA